MNYTTILAEITKDNLAVQKLTDLLRKTPIQFSPLASTYTFRPNVQSGQHLGWVGDMSDIGWKSTSHCDPEYRKPTTEVAEKVWEMGDWEAPLRFCADDFENTIAAYALKKGTPIGDLTYTDIWNVLIATPMGKAFQKMWWRFIWFGDKTATTSDLTSGVDPTLFTTCDGLWKRLFAITTANADQKSAIAANNEASRAAQMSKIRDKGVAVGIFEDILENADTRIASLPNAGIYCTRSLAKALEKDLREKYQTIMAWEKSDEENGHRVSHFDGVAIHEISTWDDMILEYQNDGTKLNLPHRAFYGSTSQLFVGSPDNAIVEKNEVWFNQDERAVKSYATGKIGTLVGEDDLFQIAF